MFNRLGAEQLSDNGSPIATIEVAAREVGVAFSLLVGTNVVVQGPTEGTLAFEVRDFNFVHEMSCEFLARRV
jgi:hypothetical protein